MSDTNPTVVAIYELVAITPIRVAEFRLDPSGAAELTLLKPGGCPMARQWLRDGIRIPGHPNPIVAADGAAFLRAALYPHQMSYCHVVDESPSVGETAGERDVRQPRESTGKHPPTRAP